MILDLNILARKPRIKKIEGNIAKASRKTKQVTWQGSIVQTVPEFSIATLGAKIVVTEKTESYSHRTNDWENGTQIFRHTLLQNTNLTCKLSQKSTEGFTPTELGSESIMQKTWKPAR